MRRSLIIAAVAVAAAVALPQVAQGATLHQDGKHRVLLQDTAGDANLVTVEGSKRVLIEDINVPIEIDDVPACMPVDAYSVSCAPSIRSIDVDLGAGADVARVATSKPVEVEGGHGRDRFHAGTGDGPSDVRWIGGISLDTSATASPPPASTSPSIWSRVTAGPATTIRCSTTSKSSSARSSTTC